MYSIKASGGREGLERERKFTFYIIYNFHHHESVSFHLIKTPHKLRLTMIYSAIMSREGRQELTHQVYKCIYAPVSKAGDAQMTN